MIDSFVTVFPIFAVILIGWSAVRAGLVREETGNGVADFVFVIAIPLMLFRTLATASLPDAPPWLFWSAYFLGLAFVWLVVAMLARSVFGRGTKEAGIIGFTVGQSNLVLLGIPLILRVFGEDGSVPLFLLVAINLPVTLTIATLMIESAEPADKRLRNMAIKLVTNPILIGIGAGLAYRQTGWSIPGPAMASLRFIGDAAAPCALFAMGAALSRYGLGGDLRLLTIVVALKIIAFPALVYVLAYKVMALPPVWAAVATVLAASPCGVNAYLLAERYRLGMGLASGAIAVSTILSVLTTTFWVWLVR